MFGSVISGFVLLAALAALAAPLQRARPATSPADMLAGEWHLNVERSRYGPSAQPRRAERLECAPSPRRMRCRLHSEFVSGAVVEAGFEVDARDGTGPVRGLAELDSVHLAPIAPGVVEATFSRRGRPIVAYRVYGSGNHQSLLFMSIDPTTRRPLTTGVVYDRVARP